MRIAAALGVLVLIAGAPAPIQSAVRSPQGAVDSPQPSAPDPQSTAASPTQPDSRPSFSEWLDGVRAEALSRGIRPEIVEEALSNIDEPAQTVIERDRSQAETVLPLETYIARQLTPTRVKTGREMLAEHHDLLERVAEKYGVPPKIIVGVWGLESNFGRFSGVRPTVAALATLAWDPRRSALFRRELFAALDILNHGDVEPSNMQGSWAGAMGQPQFMPSSYLEWAEDFDGDGRRDIWASEADVFASIANYLKGHGWVSGESWGREVHVPLAAAKKIDATVERRDGSCQARRDMTVALPMSKWRALGVLGTNGRPIAASGDEAWLVSGRARHFLVYRNYDALLEYNCAHAYAITAALLADKIAAN